jgi:hypothetical protein
VRSGAAPLINPCAVQIVARLTIAANLSEQAIFSRHIRCPNVSTDPIAGDLPVGLSGLTISGNNFEFNWATDRARSGTCRRLFIRLSVGKTAFADFKFR